MNLSKILCSPARWNIFRWDDRLLLMVIGGVVGICSGLAALALNRSLIAMEHWLHSFRNLWWAFLLPACGAALSSIFLNKILKEGAGHGVPEVIYSVSRYGGLMRLRSSFSRIISSCLTIGSGGSAGPEAPVVMSGASIGSNIAQFFSLNDRQRVTIVGCGAAGAISSIFNAPIAGLVFTIEVILGEWSAIHIVPIAIASVAGTEVSRLLQGNQIPFSHHKFHIDTLDIGASIMLAVFTAASSILLTHALRKMHKTSHKVPLPLWFRAAIGGCMVGLVGILLPDVMGEGYHAIRKMIVGGYTPGLWFIFIMVMAKILATSFTLGWGGSGGIFAPCLVIGSMTGLTFHRCLVLLWPSIDWVNEGCFALLGMAGLVSGMLHAPLTGIFLIVEITGGYDVILPLILVSSLSTTICHYIEPASFYLKDLIDQGQLLRPGTDERVLSDLTIKELLETDYNPVRQDMLLGDFIPIIKKSRKNFFPVVDENEIFAGMIRIEDIRPFIFNTSMYNAVILGQIMKSDICSVSPSDDINKVLNCMDHNQLCIMPVVNNGKFVGMISKLTLLNQYRKELIVQTSK
ncbi:chloride channel protein, CIC family [Candidatus Magnetomoraceae bacterium gMMP-15]